MVQKTPTFDDLERRYADFDTLTEALDYAAKGKRGLNFYSPRGELYEAVTYKELRERSIAIGQRLMTLGFQPGDRLALIAANTANFIANFLGAQYAGVLPVPLPLPTSFGGREGYVDQLRNQINSCGAKGVISPVDMVELIHEAAEGMGLTFAGSDEELAAVKEAGKPLHQANNDDISYLQYSSGSTRFPHGVIVTHRMLMTNCRGQGYHGVQLVDTDRCVSWLPFYHDMGLVGCLLTALCCQVSCDFMATESFARRPLLWLQLITENEGTTVSYSPTFGYDICARRAKPNAIANLDLSRWRVAGNGGDMIRPDVMQKFVDTFGPAGFPSTAFVPSYGLAECTLAVSFMPVGTGIITDMVDERILSGEIRNGHAGLNGAPHLNGSKGTALDDLNGVEVFPRYRAVVNCGVPLPDYEIEIRASDDRALTEREIGRVCVRGDSVMVGYYRDEDATNAVLSEDGWLDTGDMGYMLDGCLYIVGRSKDMIIINGKNHWPQDIEWAVEQIPGFRHGDIAAISITDMSGEEIPAVLVQCRISEDSERDALRNEVKNRVKAVTGISCLVELVPPRTLPRTSSGKLSRSKARDRYLSGGIVPLAAAS
ncbi:MAG: fatty acyl-AMP ligase [Sphingomonadales bacterium]|jgi:fatty-acyl-CoA synthase